MEKVLFLAKEKNSEDRDCVKYMEFKGFECGHYFSGLHIVGACFSGFEKEFRKLVEENYDNLETILTKEDFKKLFELQDEIKALGFGIEKDSDKYKRGIEIINEYENTIEKRLLSKENKDLFNKIIEEEKEYVAKEYGLSEIEVDDIFDNYGQDYQDRAIVGCVFKDFDDMIENEKWAYGYEEQDYFDDYAFGYDLLESEDYYQLESGKIVFYSY